MNPLFLFMPFLGQQQREKEQREKEQRAKQHRNIDENKRKRVTSTYVIGGQKYHFIDFD